MRTMRMGEFFAAAVTLAAVGLGAPDAVHAASLTTASSGTCTRTSASGTTPALYQMQVGDTCTITLSVVLTGGSDVASALRANVSLLDPENAFPTPTLSFGGPTWGTPQSSFDGQTFSVSVLSDNSAGNRQFAVATLLGSSLGTLQIVVDDLILGRDINDPPYIMDVPFTPALGSTLAFVTVVVPEPGTLSMLALGLGLLATARRRR